MVSEDTCVRSRFTIGHEHKAHVPKGLDEKVGAAGAEEVEEENLPPVLHKAWEAPRLRALNEVLGVELQPEELLLEAVEAPWEAP